ncbi:MAG TPA: phage tail protein [Xanthobacteraceae bacterium]|jgi:microcystin-dependent protein|nr:phage tail protein [Xanthobacteraceae bacterium]
MAFWKWSHTASSNAIIDSSINWAEGMAPSAVNDSARAMMARLAEWRDDISGTLVTAGSATAYTLASNQGFDNFADMNGAMLALVPHTTNGATVTLNVDGLGPKPLRYGPNLELQSGMLIQGTPYVATYNNSDGAFYLQGGFANPYGVPVGAIIPYTGTTAPSSAFALCYGQAISRTAYATLNALYSGYPFGSGDGSTTFNIPDLRGRSIFGLDNMGGSAANRITVAGGNFDGTVLGNTGGAQNQTLAQNQLPNIVPTFTGTQQTWSLNQGVQESGVTATAQGGSTFTAPQNNPGTATVTVTPAGSISSINGNVTQQAHPILSPAMTLPYILRII